MEAPKDIVVVKYGSTSVTTEHGMDTERLHRYSEEIAHLTVSHEVIIVSSGATVTGQALYGDMKKTTDRNFAAMGSGNAFVAWQEELLTHNMFSAPILVTNHEIDSVEGITLRESLLSLMDDDIIPLANGNDVLSKEGIRELKIDTDNDRLAGHIAQLIGAKHLILLTDKAGVLDERDRVVRYIQHDNVSEASSVAYETGKGAGGGMPGKISVAYNASHPLRGRNPITAHIAHAETRLQAVIDQQVGTHFLPRA